MFKVFYNLQSDLVDRQAGNIGLIDILQSLKCSILTDPNQLKGEKVDVVYMNHDEKLLAQINDLQIKKISIIIKNEDDVIVPRNFVKYSSDLTETTTGKYYNVILNHKNYKTENEFIILGEDNPHQDVVRNLYALYGNVITSTMKKYETSKLLGQIKSRNLPNCGNIYLFVHMMLEGLKKCVIKKNIIKVRPDEHFADISQVLMSLQNENKIVMTNAFMKKNSQIKFFISDHLLAGKYEQIFKMYNGAMEILNNKITEMRKRIRLEYTPEQILVLGYLKDTFYFLGGKDEKYVKETMIKNFSVVPMDVLGHFKIFIGKKVLIKDKGMSKELYDSVNEIKTINEI